MNRLWLRARSSIGRKLLMATSGLMLLGFLFVHLLGNLLLYQGPDALNAYAAWLQGLPILWPVRLALLAIFAVHVAMGILLAAENRRSTPTGYRTRAPQPVRLWASRYMWLTGLVVLGFVAYHLLHLTFGVIAPEFGDLYDAEGRHDVFSAVVYGFLNPWIAGTYIAAMLLLGIHLAHGAQSLFQTLGLNHRSYNQLIRWGTWAIVATIVLGNISFPLSVLGGVVAPVGDLGQGP